MSHKMIVKFWGVRGSHPTPGRQTVRFGGNTPCVEVQAGGQSILLDAGTGIIPLGRDMARRSAQKAEPLDITLLFSHVHHDHTQGFPFFTPAYIPSTRLHIFGPVLDRDLEQVIAGIMSPPLFPITLREMSASKTFHSLPETDVIYLGGSLAHPLVVPFGEPAPEDAVCIRTLHSYAHPGGVQIYRIEWRDLSVVYATDTEGYAKVDRRLAHFAQGASLLIHDAQYTEEHYLGLAAGQKATQGWGHSTAGMACDLARTAGVGRLGLFHYDPRYSDETIAGIEAEAQQSFPGAIAVYEGLELVLSGGNESRRFARRPAAYPLQSGMHNMEAKI